MSGKKKIKINKKSKRSEAVRRFLTAIIGIPVTIDQATETDVTSTSAQFAWRCGIAPLTPPPHSFPPPLILYRFRILELTSARPCYHRATLFERHPSDGICVYISVGIYIDFRQCINAFRQYDRRILKKFIVFPGVRFRREWWRKFEYLLSILLTIENEAIFVKQIVEILKKNRGNGIIF